MKKVFEKKYLLDDLALPWSKHVVCDKIIDTTRWSEIHDLVFVDHDGLNWNVQYSQGLTEFQDESAFEYSEDQIECTLVELRDFIIKKWLPVDSVTDPED